LVFLASVFALSTVFGTLLFFLVFPQRWLLFTLLVPSPVPSTAPAKRIGPHLACWSSPLLPSGVTLRWSLMLPRRLTWIGLSLAMPTAWTAFIASTAWTTPSPLLMVPRSNLMRKSGESSVLTNHVNMSTPNPTRPGLWSPDPHFGSGRASYIDGRDGMPLHKATVPSSPTGWTCSQPRRHNLPRCIGLPTNIRLLGLLSASSLRFEALVSASLVSAL
jgi:hypothetical protein